MDYETLLRKYMEYVRDVEGIDFINPVDRCSFTDITFTDEEWATLENISMWQRKKAAAGREE